MASSYWIKLYYEILDDPKMGKLPDWLFRRAIELFLLAGENNKDGLLQPVADMAWRIRTDEKRFADSLQALSKVGVVHETPEGWVVTNFSERQAAVPDVERQRYKRERDKKGSYYGHAPVTKRDTDTDTEVDTETDSEAEADARKPAAAAAFDPVMTAYSNNIGSLTPMISEALADFEKETSAEWVILAIQEAVRYEKRNLGYVKAILNRWKVDGFKSSKDKKPAQAQTKAVSVAAAWLAKQGEQ